jgi:ParB family chromosome partitioning protein
MSKRDNIRSGAGGNIRASLGVGRTFSTRPADAPEAPDEARRQGVTRSKDTAEIRLERIVPDPDQPREEFDEDALARLAESLKTRGQLQPIRVRWDEGQGAYVIICGERRWRAARMAGLPSLTCVVHEGAVDVLAVQLIENALREDLKPVEQARAFKALMERSGWDKQTLAAELNVAPGTVTRTLALLELPTPVQEKVEQGALPASTAYEISRLDSPEAQAQMAELAVSEGLTKTEVHAAVNHVKATRRPAAARPEPRTYDLGSCTVTVRWKRAGGPDAAEALRLALAEEQGARENAA